MQLLDIEKVINQKNIASRFKLVYLAGLRAKELNEKKDDDKVALPTHLAKKLPHKVTTRALSELINHKIVFYEELHGPSVATTEPE